jgi:hypothetical protein
MTGGKAEKTTEKREAYSRQNTERSNTSFSGKKEGGGQYSLQRGHLEEPN